MKRDVRCVEINRALRAVPLKCHLQQQQEEEEEKEREEEDKKERKQWMQILIN